MKSLFAFGTGGVCKSIAAALLVMIGCTANAASVSIFLDQSNENTAIPDGTNYLKVTISDGAAGAIDFTVETLAPLSGIADSNYGIQRFGFNFGDSGATVANIVPPSGWSITSEFNFSGYGDFDVALSGTGSNRLDPLTFSVVGVAGDVPADYLTMLSTGTAGEGNQLFAARVAGFDGPDGISSAQFGGSAVVPLPASAWLMLSGLGALFALRRRRQANGSGIQESFQPALAAA